jgi:hypothetical protein
VLYHPLSSADGEVDAEVIGIGILLLCRCGHHNTNSMRAVLCFRFRVRPGSVYDLCFVAVWRRSYQMVICGCSTLEAVCLAGTSSATISTHCLILPLFNDGAFTSIAHAHPIAIQIHGL